MDKETVRKIADKNCDDKILFGKDRHVDVCVREYEMLQNIGGKSIKEVAEFFRVSDDDITRVAWIDFMRGMQESFDECIQSSKSNE